MNNSQSNIFGNPCLSVFIRGSFFSYESIVRLMRNPCSSSPYFLKLEVLTTRLSLNGRAINSYPGDRQRTKTRPFAKQLQVISTLDENYPQKICRQVDPQNRVRCFDQRSRDRILTRRQLATMAWTGQQWRGAGWKSAHKV
jgi:hypothetical protein